MYQTVFVAAVTAFLFSWQLKHFFCDFVWQNKYMLGKFKKWPWWILPLTTHCCVHALGTLVLVLLFRFPFWFIAVDFVSHFVIDRLKAHPRLGSRWTSENKYFWWGLGADQFAHQLVGIFFIGWLFY